MVTEERILVEFWGMRKDRFGWILAEDRNGLTAGDIRGVVPADEGQDTGGGICPFEVGETLISVTG